ncbi:hypothetical protein ZHAS_00015977 [Anopheles sinensis]|uniref:Uncharacterized protein n=1 Tax=Anopheles sinensis TaxID=74873 RepID=A0A084WCH4_ANOSI|nr:hypothetical protein ZHAS_00015977 [Anopheles sinensis]
MLDPNNHAPMLMSCLSCPGVSGGGSSESPIRASNPSTVVDDRIPEKCRACRGHQLRCWPRCLAAR